MKTRSGKVVRFLLAAALAAWMAARPGKCQTPTELKVKTYAGLTITGAVGTVYLIEYLTDLDQTNNANAWRCLEFLQLPASPYLWPDNSTPARAKRFYQATAMGAPMNMVFIPPGTFRMGSPTNDVDRFSDEGPQTEVTISRGFWIGKYEVTQGEFEALQGSNPSVNAGDPKLPVDGVSWDDAVVYCEALTRREQLAGRIRANSRYRLPTEAEWEYACRGWTSTRFSYGEDPGYTHLTNYAWYQGNSQQGNVWRSWPVGQKLPNPWGLYDMHGNVWELCQDWWSPYRGGIAIDPQGPSVGERRIIRGGHWDSDAKHCRAAFRFSGTPDDRYFGVGFRVVLAPGQP